LYVMTLEEKVKQSEAATEGQVSFSRHALHARLASIFGTNGG
jgi:hypothetical protein